MKAEIQMEKKKRGGGKIAIPSRGRKVVSNLNVETEKSKLRVYPGDLVWVRRRNGAWWPGIVISPDQVPSTGPRPPRSGNSVAIKLLGRLDGSIDWFNLERSSRVKPFRCGEYDKCIEKAQAQAGASGPRRAVSERKYVRREDAIIHALEIEKSCCMLSDSFREGMNNSQGRALRTHSMESRTRSAHEKRLGHDFSSVEKKCLEDFTQPTLYSEQGEKPSTSSTRYGSRKKKRAQKLLEDDLTAGMRRMRNLKEIGSIESVIQNSVAASCSIKVPQEPNPPDSGSSACIDLLANQNEVKCNMPTNLSAKRRRSNMEQAYENLRKKERLRSLSGLHEGNGVITSQHCQWGASVQSSLQPSCGDALLDGRQDYPIATQKMLDNSAPSSVVASADTFFCYQSANGKKTQMKTSGFPDMPRFVPNGFSNGSLNVFSLNGDENGRGEKQHNEGPLKSSILQLGGESCVNGDVGSNGWSHQSSKNLICMDEEQFCDETAKNQSPSCKIDGSYGNSDDVMSNESHEFYSGELIVDPVPLAQIIPKEMIFSASARINVGELNSICGLECDGKLKSMDSCLTSKTWIATSDLSVHDVPLLESSEVPKFSDPVTPQLRGPKAVKCVSLDVVGLHDVKLEEQPIYRGRNVPLVSLWSTLNRQHIRGYPVEVQVLSGGECKSENDHRPLMSSLSQLLKRSDTKVRSDRRTYTRKKPINDNNKKKRRKGLSTDRRDKSWTPHCKKSGASPRKMRRLSSFAADQHQRGKGAVKKMPPPPSVACVPVRLVYIRLHEALTRSENPS